jgi:DNA-binding protein HU-beta
MAKTLLVKSQIEDVLGDDLKFMSEVSAIRDNRQPGEFLKGLRGFKKYLSPQPTFNRSDLVDAVAGRARLSKSEANKAVEAVFDSITAALKEGGEVRLVGFGTFSVARRSPSEGRNPRTGEKIKIAASNQTKFKPGRRLRNQVD